MRVPLLGLLALAVLVLWAGNAPLASAFTATSVDAGDYHTCALTPAGGAKCWGLNNYGQLGEGTYTDRTTPVDVTGLTSGVAAVAAGRLHSCAVTTLGGVKCWGSNSYGQLGDGTTTDSTTAVDVTGLGSGIAAVAAGDNHTCALTTAGGLRCWGRNSKGQLGDGTTIDRTTPVDVTGLATDIGAVAAGSDHTCALTTAGGLKCWGSNSWGVLGDGLECGLQCVTPVDVTGLGSGTAAVAAGSDHTCAVTTAGGLKCWGYNGNGQLGDGTTTYRTTPTDVTGLGSGVSAVGAGWGHTCALTTAGGVKCWGDNLYGQIGDGTTTDRTTPVDVTGLGSGVVAVAADSTHTCAVTTTGALKSWGDNRNGQLGDGTVVNRTTPVDVIEGPDSDDDGFPDLTDNCPNTPNPGQQNSVHSWTPAGDHCEDPDSDLVFDVSDNCPDTSNAGQENADGDYWGDACDNCPTVLTYWYVPVGDDDCDAWTTDDEQLITTDPYVACGVNAWPPDFNDDQVVNILDVVQLTPPYFNTSPPDPNYSIRKDIRPDGTINILDIVLLMPPMFHTWCTP